MGRSLGRCRFAIAGLLVCLYGGYAWACSPRPPLPAPVDSSVEATERWRQFVLTYDSEVRIAARVVEVREQKMWTNLWNGVADDKLVSVPTMLVEVLDVQNARNVFSPGRRFSVIATVPCSNQFSKIAFKQGDQIGIMARRPSRFGDILEVDARDIEQRIVPLKDAWFITR
jgi:hypothetical protein